MEDNIFPLSRAIKDEDPNQLEEERRLAYVGITRAREELYLTSAYTRMMYGSKQYNSQSRFIGEIKDEDLDIVASTAPKSSTSFLDLDRLPLPKSPKPKLLSRLRSTGPARQPGPSALKRRAGTLATR